MEPERRLHQANAGRESKPMAWRLEGGEAIWIAGSLGGSILLFRLFYGAWNWGVMTSVAFAALPFFVVGVIVLILVNGKPKHYALEFAEWLLIRLALGFRRAPLRIQFFRSATGGRCHPLFEQETARLR